MTVRFYTKMAIFSIAVHFLSSCTGNTPPAEPIEKVEEIDSTIYDPFANLDKTRTVFTGTDSLKLSPFEIYTELQFKDAGICGMFQVITVEEVSGNRSITELKLEEIVNTNDFRDCAWKSNSLILKLGSFNREVYKNKPYKALIGYSVDEESHRSNLGMCDYSGYFIIDIVPQGERFKRQDPMH